MLPSLFISHGSPMLALAPGASGAVLKDIAARLAPPRAILVVSAHWESPELQIMSTAKPQTWHDFGGFPPALYSLRYPATGAPQLAEQILALLREAGLSISANSERPFDHGAWIPLSALDFEATAERSEPWAQEFRDWIVENLLQNNLPALLDYRRQAPHARLNHPTEEHLLPLFFARGAGPHCTVEHQGFALGTLGMDIYSFT
jgi:4,5-DOPA dioxygenase extradiol